MYNCSHTMNSTASIRPRSPEYVWDRRNPAHTITITPLLVPSPLFALLLVSTTLTMPTIEPPTAPSAGAISFHYTISTPTCASASTIDPALPTLLFLHSVYGDQVMLHCEYYPPLSFSVCPDVCTPQGQFADCNVRRYNCVAVDLREHGLTQNAPVPEGYGVREGAEDVAAFMVCIASDVRTRAVILT